MLPCVRRLAGCPVRAAGLVARARGREADLKYLEP